MGKKKGGEPPLSEQGFGEPGSPDFVSLKDVAQYRGMIFVRKTLGAKTADGSDLLDEQIVEYIRVRRREQADKVSARERKIKARNRLLPTDSPARFKASDKEIEEGMADLLQSFEATTANDRVTARIFVRNSLIIQKISDAMDDVRGVTDPDTVKAYVALNTEMTNLQKMNLDYQKTLGIDRQTRDKSKRDRSLVDLHAEEVAAADEFVQQQIIKTVCPSCQSLLGWTYDLYRELKGWYKITTCHPCGKVWLQRGGVEKPIVLPLDHPVVRALQQIPTLTLSDGGFRE